MSAALRVATAPPAALDPQQKSETVAQVKQNLLQKEPLPAHLGLAPLSFAGKRARIVGITHPSPSAAAAPSASSPSASGASPTPPSALRRERSHTERLPQAEVSRFREDMRDGQRQEREFNRELDRILAQQERDYLRSEREDGGQALDDDGGREDAEERRFEIENSLTQAGIDPRELDDEYGINLFAKRRKGKNRRLLRALRESA